MTELNKDDIGKIVLWIDAQVRTAQLLSFNPAIEDGDPEGAEVLVAPSSGGRKWVRLRDLRRISDDAPDGFAGLVDVSADLLAYDQLKEHVRELLSHCLSSDSGTRIDSLESLLGKLRQDVEG